MAFSTYLITLLLEKMSMTIEALYGYSCVSSPLPDCQDSARMRCFGQL
jgi:hypothetical protein